jgi:hypothetical protein
VNIRALGVRASGRAGGRTGGRTGGNGGGRVEICGRETILFKKPLSSDMNSLFVQLWDCSRNPETETVKPTRDKEMGTESVS